MTDSHSSGHPVGQAGYTELTEEQMLRINELCDQFESDWKAGQQPSIETTLQKLPPADRPPALAELLPLEIEYRRRAGTELRFDEYATRFPSLDRTWLASLLEAASIAVPNQLGDYLILSRIGGGGMGTVYKALHQRMGRTVALKVLRSEIQRNPELLRRFDREVRAAARLNHRNIVAALDAREDQEIHYLVTEYVEGNDLERIVRQQGPLPLKPALEAILQAARGLEFAHAQGIIHRDIKPANLFRDLNGIVKILDMGLARFDDATEAQHDSLTKTGMVMGTAHFMAPEQARDTRRADARSDIYSLGCTLFYLLTGKVPFSGETTIDTILSHVNRPAPSLRETANLPAVVDVLFQKMVAKDPQDRFQSAAELIAAIKSLSVKPTTASTPQKPPQPLSPTVLAPVEPAVSVPRSRSLIPLTVGVLSFLIVGIPAYFYFSSPSQEPTTIQPPPPQEQQTPVAQQNTVLPTSPTVEQPPLPTSPPPTTPNGNYSLEFDGHSSYAHVPDLHPVAGQNYTIEVIARVRGVTVANVVSWLGPDWMSLFVNENGWGVGRKFNGRSHLIFTGHPPDLDRTHHVAATYDGSNLKLYIDGRLADSSPTQFDILDARGGLYIGGLDRNDLDEIRYFDGYVDLVRISRGLRYTSDFSPPTSFVHDGTTLALFPFNEGDGSTANSLDPIPHTATLTNTTWHQE